MKRFRARIEDVPRAKISHHFLSEDGSTLSPRAREQMSMTTHGRRRRHFLRAVLEVAACGCWPQGSGRSEDLQHEGKSSQDMGFGLPGPQKYAKQQPETTQTQPSFYILWGSSNGPKAMAESPWKGVSPRLLGSVCGRRPGSFGATWMTLPHRFPGLISAALVELRRATVGDIPKPA